MNMEQYKAIETEFDTIIDIVRLKAYAETGYEWMVCPGTGAFRSLKEQHGLFIRPFDGIDNDKDGQIDEADEFVTKADAGQSPHNFDLARDLYPCKKSNEPWFNAPKKLFSIMGKIAEDNGLIWGGHFSSFYDGPHVEHSKWREVKAAWKKGELKGLV